MASKQTQEQELEQSQEQTQPRDDPNRLVKVKLRFDKNNKSKGMYVNVNNHNFFIPTGKVVEVPYYIAAVIENSANQDENTAALVESLRPEADF